MFKVFTAFFLLLILVAFQNCSGKVNSADNREALEITPAGYKLVSITPITADSLLLGEGFSGAVAMSTAAAMMPLPGDTRIELRMNKNELVRYYNDLITPPRFCDLSDNAEYLELKRLLLLQSVCYFESVVTDADRLARQAMCPLNAAGAVNFDFSVYTYKPGESSQLLTSVNSRRALLESFDPYCVSGYTSFCTDNDNDRIAELAQSLADQISTLNGCFDDTIVGPAK